MPAQTEIMAATTFLLNWILDMCASIPAMNFSVTNRALSRSAANYASRFVVRLSDKTENKPPGVIVRYSGICVRGLLATLSGIDYTYEGQRR